MFSIKTVGRVKYRYRLVHWWVAEMLLNVQSESFFNKGKAQTPHNGAVRHIETQGIVQYSQGQTTFSTFTNKYNVQGLLVINTTLVEILK